LEADQQPPFQDCQLGLELQCFADGVMQVVDVGKELTGESEALLKLTSGTALPLKQGIVWSELC